MTEIGAQFRSRCMRCGADLPPWFDPSERFYDTERDDAAYARWLDTPCESCGSTPRENGAR